MTKPEFQTLMRKLQIPSDQHAGIWRISFRLSLPQVEAAIRSGRSSGRVNIPSFRLSVARAYSQNVHRARTSADENHPCAFCEKGIVFARTAAGAEYSFACSSCLKPRVLGLKFPVWNDQEGFTREQRAM